MSPARLELGRLARATALLASLGCAAAALGCGPDYDHTTIDGVRPSPLGGMATYARIEVPLGMIVTAHIVSYDDDRHEMPIELVATRPDVVEVTKVVTANDYAFFGLKPGTSDVRLSADGKVVLIVQAVVVDQPPLP